MKIGLISDTHNHWDPLVAKRFAGVDHIIHAGDIGQTRILLELEGLAPVTAVLGNNDTGLPLKLTERVKLGGRDILTRHIVPLNNLPPELRDGPGAEPPEIVVFGHTHRRQKTTLGRTLFVNPGYAGAPRFGMPRSVALLHLNGPEELQIEFLDLTPV
jgi:hypothetical protein